MHCVALSSVFVSSVSSLHLLSNAEAFSFSRLLFFFFFKILSWLCRKGEETLSRYNVTPAESLAAARLQQREFQRFLNLAQVSGRHIFFSFLFFFLPLCYVIHQKDLFETKQDAIPPLPRPLLLRKGGGPLSYYSSSGKMMINSALFFKFIFFFCI